MIVLAKQKALSKELAKDFKSDNQRLCDGVFSPAGRADVPRKVPRTIKLHNQLVSGCGAVGSALPWGGRGRKFKSCHSDQNEGS